MELAKPQTVQQLNPKVSGWFEDDLQIFLAVLLSVGMLNPAQAETCSKPEDHPVLLAWEFHDLLFHFRSRRGRHLAPVGKTFHRLDQFAPLPVVKPMASKQQIYLYTPNLDKLKETDVPFSQVLEARRSIRTHAVEPLSAEQIGEFLYRCARIRDIFPKDQREASSRPYPNGGACYELELYLIIMGCEGLSAGLYHYCPRQHCLEQLSEPNSAIAQLVEEAKFTASLPADPQILIVITARFARVSWLYQSMAYSLVLKHVGVLYQTMYLVATAMQLAPCALGTGNSDLFALAADIDPYVEPAVGEFILGSKPLIEI
jgi:SagB-type dehydrogenase family enzyme